jgi:hypothetical protein
MEKEFIPYDLALRMKSLGFDDTCFRFYWENSTKMMGEHSSPNSNSDLDNLSKTHLRGLQGTSYCALPTWQQAFRFFRQEHNLKFHIREDVWNNWCSLKMIRHDDYISIGEYKTYEEAELECLKKLIEIVENEKTL